MASLRAHLLDVCSHARWLVGDVQDDADGEPEPRRAERERFRTYVAQLSEVEVEHLARVPTRYVLEATERRSRLQRIARAWPQVRSGGIPTQLYLNLLVFWPFKAPGSVQTSCR